MHSAFIEKPPNRLFLEYQLHFCAIYEYAEHKDAFLGFRDKCSQYPNKLLLNHYRIFPSQQIGLFFFSYRIWCASFRDGNALIRNIKMSYFSDKR